MKGKDKKRVGLLGLTSRALMLVAAGCLVLSYLSVFVNPAKAWFMTLFGLFFVPFLLLNVFLLVWAAVRRSRAILIPLLALIPAFFLTGRFIQFTEPEETAGDGIKIVSYNVGRFALSAKRLHLENRQACADSVFRFLRAQQADIICLQEFHWRDAGEIKARLAKEFPGYNAEYFVFTDRSGCYGNVTLSRFPSRGKGKLDFDKSSNLAIWSEYDVDGTRMRVYNCHFQSYNISFSRILRALRSDYKQTVRDTEERMKASIILRPEQVNAVLNDIAGAPVPSVITGDFNDNPLSYTYRRLSHGRKDSFVEAGKGSGATYALLRPFLRIDYILYPDAYHAVAHQVPHCRYSDHYPVIASIQP